MKAFDSGAFIVVVVMDKYFDIHPFRGQFCLVLCVSL